LIRPENIIGVLGQKNVTNLSGLTLTVEDDSAVKTEARNKAITQAKTQAEANRLLVSVSAWSRITNFSESGSAQPIYYSKDMMVGATSAAAPTPSIPVGQNTASSDVTITYENSVSQLLFV